MGGELVIRGVSRDIRAVPKLFQERVGTVAHPARVHVSHVAHRLKAVGVRQDGSTAARALVAVFRVYNFLNRGKSDVQDKVYSRIAAVGATRWGYDATIGV